ncbi:predicted protein [Naegleria gruberi]|uniref:Predicted protein n=1 Tax=Naegleria gruberi TaxID=5762 RepID=D2W3R2_NAEGR|nr:uncharacterized protein NAEGRDRAFT_76037 [Naegleria gruberi]EFC36308.1 predicted protein [Naegleria gruberi]|eukprot:XP_002669052.1 predicted protein [Naegleria gruberi strain NEG-M]
MAENQKAGLGKKISSQRYQISQTFTYGSAEKNLIVREFGEFDLKGAVLIEGFPSGATTISTAAGYVVEQLDLPLIGDVISEVFPPVCLINNYTPQSGVRIYGNNKIVVFTSEYELKDPFVSHQMVNALFEFGKRHGCKCIVSLEAIPMDEKKKRLIAGEDVEDIQTPIHPPSREELLKLLTAASNEDTSDQSDSIYFITNDQEMADTLVKYGHFPIKDNIVLSGISSVVLGKAPFTDLVVVGLFAPISLTQEILSTKPIISIVHAIDKLLGEELFIKTDKLEKTGEAIRIKLNEVLEKQKETKDAYNPMFL